LLCETERADNEPNDADLSLSSIIDYSRSQPLTVTNQIHMVSQGISIFTL
jgi:hypothetical protein